MQFLTYHAHFTLCHPPFTLIYPLPLGYSILANYNGCFGIPGSYSTESFASSFGQDL
jgi:hypothetical protein